MEIKKTGKNIDGDKRWDIYDEVYETMFDSELKKTTSKRELELTTQDAPRVYYFYRSVAWEFFLKMAKDTATKGWPGPEEAAKLYEESFLDIKQRIQTKPGAFSDPKEVVKAAKYANYVDKKPWLSLSLKKWKDYYLTCFHRAVASRFAYVFSKAHHASYGRYPYSGLEKKGNLIYNTVQDMVSYA